jgi:hypothetical protein
MKYLVLFLGLVFGHAALAQSSPAYVVAIGPTAVKGFGTLSAGNSSTLLSTLTTGPSSGAWPSPVPGMLYVLNNGTTTIYICPLGGSCTSSNGLAVPAGQYYGFYQPSTSMTLISPTTATVQAQW